ncbi:MAG: hypothetical protein QNL33_08190 [Akkermansiaceae bacterium]|jgi:hypothetical protein
MNRLSAILILIWSLVPTLGAQDPATESIGTMSVELIYATDGVVDVAGLTTKELASERIKELHSVKELKFQNYRLLGSDVSNILNGYEGWATPLKPSKEILVSFQPIKRGDGDRMQMVLEYWQGKQKIFATNPTLTKGKAFYLVGPKWRKGRVIIAVKILTLDK